MGLGVTILSASESSSDNIAEDLGGLCLEVNKSRSFKLIGVDALLLLLLLPFPRLEKVLPLWETLGVPISGPELMLFVLLFLVVLRKPSSIETMEFLGLSKLAIDRLLVRLD